MSLINQVLRDLDRRHAATGAMPAAVKSLPPAPPKRGRLVGWTAAALAAAVAGGLAWSVGARSSTANAAMVAVAPAPSRPSVPTAVVVVPAIRAASAASSPAVIAAPTSPTRVAPARVAAPPAPHVVAEKAVAATVAPPSSSPAEPRIDKHPPLRTAHERAQADYQRGVAAHQQGRWDDAAAAYADTLREEPGFATARQALAGLLIAQQRGDDAKALLAEGLALAPHEEGLAMLQARLLAGRGELQRAAEILQTAAIASPRPEDAAFHAAILQRLGRHAQAAELFAAALRVTPGNGVWWMGLGLSLAAQGRNDEAREAFNRARASGSLSPELAAYVEQQLHQLL
ncbi:MAG TPA: tetratricopeptide repeat protein [Albitalea sp.]|nr:tetratricopeptide repeat protein [Albitalea sp.]